jgi:hypothetical protein
MIGKKLLTMIKGASKIVNYTNKKRLDQFGARVAQLAAISCGLSFLLLTFAPAAGFSAGLLAFVTAFLGVERVMIRVLEMGVVRAGVRSSIFWVFFKFLVPPLCIFLGLRFGSGVLSLFSGLCFGLGLSVGVLGFYRRFERKGVE